ncbi:MAG TPA: methylmalonyl-CoA mutase family protein [Chloroflexota bacterium]|nr:methylmalonyl-CoA mutase family protein [Chloroflexota bacterium]
MKLESGIEVKKVYDWHDLEGWNPETELGQPGEYPFTRGIHPGMYCERVWTMRQYTGFGSPADTNQRFKFLIDHGQTGLNVAFDLPTQQCLDSDDPMAEGEVGRVGMAVDSLRDFEVAFDGIPIDKVSVSLTINAPASILIAMFLVAAEQNGTPFDKVPGTAQNDILKEYIGRGAWVFDVPGAIKLIGDTIEFCAKVAPRYSPVSVCGYHVRESGATPAQEIAYGFAIAEEYVQNVLDRGLKVDDFASGFSFNFNVYGNLWEQVAKFRAGRRLWARLLKEKYGSKNPRSQWMRMIAGGGGSGLTWEEPENNIVRGAYYALAGALGGAQTMALCCYDEAYTIPTPKAQLISLRTMQILAEEIGLDNTVDPLAGSYFIESLTNEMEQKIKEHMDEVEAWGGMTRAVKEGLIQEKVSQQAYEYERRLRTGDEVKIGVNKYATGAAERQEIELHPYDEEAVASKVTELQELRRSRDSAAVQRELTRLETAARAGENLMPYLMDAVKTYATVGEISKVFLNVFGAYKEPAAV